MLFLLAKITEMFAKSYVSRLINSKPNLEIHRALIQRAKNIALYLHIPYCPVPVCRFCSFVRYPVRDPALTKPYYIALKKELDMYIEVMPKGVGSVYFGGGTPTICPECLAELVEYIHDVFGWDIPVTVEANPRTITRDDLERLHKAGVSRISIGIQSFQKWKLDALGRYVDSIEHAKDIVRYSRDLFETVNIDIIWGIKGETVKSVIFDAEEAFNLEPHQVTFYPIMPPLLNLPNEEKLEGPPIRHEISLYGAILKVAMDRGYYPSTPWCMVRGTARQIDEYITEYNDFVGVGLSSIGKIGAYSYVNTFSTRKYFDRISRGVMSVSRAMFLNRMERALFESESVMFGLKIPKCTPEFGILGSLLMRTHVFLFRLLRPGSLLYYYTLHLVQKTLYSTINALRKIGVKNQI